MKFARVYESLKLLEKEPKLTIKDALDVFYDLYEDVKDSEGAVLENQPVGDVDEFVGRLCWMARTTARIYTKNSEELKEAGAESRWEKANEKLSLAVRDLEDLEENAAAMRGLKQKQEATLRVWETRKEEVASMENAIAEQKKQIQHFEQLEQQCDIVREETERKRREEFPRIQEKIRKADEEMAEVQKLIEAENEKLREAEARRDEKKAAFAEARNREMALAAECEKIAGEISNSKNNYTKAMEQKNVQELELKNLQDLAYAKWQEVEAEKIRLQEAKNNEKAELQRRREEAAEKLKSTEAEIEALKQKIRETEENGRAAAERLLKLRKETEAGRKTAEAKAALLDRLIGAAAGDATLKESWGMDPAQVSRLEEKLRSGQEKLEEDLEAQKQAYRRMLELMEG